MPKKNRGAVLEWRPERNDWEIIWYVGGKRKRKSTGCTDSAAADEKLKEFKETAKKRRKSRLVDDVLSAYQKEHAPHTARPEDIYQCVINLTPFFGGLAVEEVTKAKCQEFATKRKTQIKPNGEIKILSDATIRKDLEILRAALNHDHSESRCSADFYVWMPEKPEPRERCLSRKEAADLLRAAKESPWYVWWFIFLSLHTAQREGAVLNLHWDRIDLERGKINWQYGKKTNKRRPKQPMTDEIKSLMRYLARYGNGYALHRDGRPMQKIYRGVEAAYKRAGIEGASPHTLKHTAITWMLRDGADIWDVAGFTGTSAKTIEGTYGHHCPNHLEGARTSSRKARERRITAPKTAPIENTKNADVEKDQ